MRNIIVRTSLLALDLAADLARSRIVSAAMAGGHGWRGVLIAAAATALYRLAVWAFAPLRKG